MRKDEKHPRAAATVQGPRSAILPPSARARAVNEVDANPSIAASSRRALLTPFAATPVVAGRATIEALDQQFAVWGDEPTTLRRTPEGRSASEGRYDRAEEFFASIEEGFHRDRSNLLYQTGIVMQLGLSSHLLDIGFDDRWCAQNLGHRVAKSLAYANATGLGHEGPEVELLATILTPYWKWNSLSQIRAKESGRKPDDGPFSHDDICRLTRTLLDHVRYLTGHPRPQWWGTRHA